MEQKISAVYQIKNAITDEMYVGSSIDVKKRWTAHKSPSVWKKCPNSKLYQDFQKYGLGNFKFVILALVMPECLKRVEQEFIDIFNPTYNDRWSNGNDAKRYKKSKKKAKDKINKKYQSQRCLYNGKELTLGALVHRFYRADISHPVLEAKKYLIHS